MLDPFVDDIKELMGKQIQFIVKVTKAVFEVNVKDGGRCKFRDSFVRYKVDHTDLGEEVSQSARVADTTIEPQYKHAKKFKRFVDDGFAKHLMKGKIVFQVFAKLTDQSAATSTRRDVVLPDGWKKVTAFQDPQGGLHLQPPKG